MRKWTVELSVSGYLLVEIEADSKEEAARIAVERHEEARGANGPTGTYGDTRYHRYDETSVEAHAAWPSVEMCYGPTPLMVAIAAEKVAGGQAVRGVHVHAQPPRRSSSRSSRTHPGRLVAAQVAVGSHDRKR